MTGLGLDALEPSADRREALEVETALIGDVGVGIERDVMIYLYHQNWLYGLSAKLTGFTPVPDGLIRLRDVKFKS